MVKIKRFTAQWCGPCKMLAPVFIELEKEFPNVVFETIDVDENREEVVNYVVTSVPTVIIEKDGQLIQRYTGAKPKSVYATQIKSLI